MRAIALALLLLAVPIVPAQDGSIRIVELLAEPDGTREFIELHNTGPSQDLAGWIIEDSAGNRFTFTAQTLAQGQRLVVWGGGEPTPEGPAWGQASVWNNGGDTATLRDSDGQVADTFTYPMTARAERGMAYVWGQGWTTGTPTPGHAPGSQGGHATGTVPDLPAELWIEAPTTGDGRVAVTIGGTDDNGDPFPWSFHAQEVLLANGTGDFELFLDVDVQDGADLWLRAGNQTVHHRIEAAGPAFEVRLPAEGLQFPPLIPGAESVLALAPFTLVNHDDGPRTLRIDVSDFQGPGRMEVAGRLQLGIGETWIDYQGPLTELPELAPGENDVRMRLTDIPVPLPAGAYGTSFSVIA